MIGVLDVITGVFVGTLAGGGAVAASGAHWRPAGVGAPVGCHPFWTWFLVFAASVAGGYFADYLFNKTRRYDADYDDRPPTDPA